MITSKFNKIGLVGRPDHSGVVTSLEKLVSYLNGKAVTIVADSGTADLMRNVTLEVVPRADLGDSCDLVIVVGGDGSILNIAKYVLSTKVPVIGVNRGKLGFLTDILPDEIESKLDDVLSGFCSVEERFLLDIYLLRSDECKYLGSALNDVVLHPGSAAQMIEFELFIDDVFVYSQESDGLIIATPTGSTAYALSAGGPIMHPSLDAMVLAPMYPHSLSSRPVVVGGDSQIKLTIPSIGSRQPQISCDGDLKYSANGGDQFLVTKKTVPLHLIHPPGHSFYEACRSKLGWGSRLVKKND